MRFPWSKSPKPNKTENTLGVVNSYLDGVFNSGTLTWNDIFGNVHPRELRGDSQLGLSAIYCALNMYIGAILSMPRIIHRLDPRTGEPTSLLQTTQHPASRLWSAYVNDDTTSDDMLKNIVYDVLYADGNYYALNEYDAQGRVSRLHYIHPDRIPKGNITRALGGEKLSDPKHPIATKGELLYKVLTGIEIRDAKEEYYLLPAKSLTHIRGIIPDRDNHRGMGIQENNRESAGLYRNAMKMASSYYHRGHAKQTYLSTEKGLTPKLRKDLESEFNDTDDVGDMFKTKILELGLKPVFLGRTLPEMQFIETHAMSVEEVSRWFCMPPSLLHNLMTGGAAPAELDQQMSFWIQNGLNSQITNIANGFRDNVFPQASRTLYKCEFQTIQLYRTVITDFSEALRNLFEIGVLNRLSIASLYGIHLDPANPANKAQHVPANLLTVEHSRALAAKAVLSTEVMQESLQSMKQKRELELEAAQNPEPEPVPGEDPSVQHQDAEESQDNSTAPTPTKGTIPEDSKPKVDNLTYLALYNVLKGLHEHELRVLNQKAKSRSGEEFKKATAEFYPKFKAKLKSALNDWKPIINQMPVGEAYLREDHKFNDLIGNWISYSELVHAEGTYPDPELTDFFNSQFDHLRSTNAGT